MSRAHGPARACTRAGARAGAVGVLAVLLVSCAGEQDVTGVPQADPGMGHVHGVGVDPASGDVLAATHTGLFLLRDGWAPRRVAERW